MQSDALSLAPSTTSIASSGLKPVESSKTAVTALPDALPISCPSARVDVDKSCKTGPSSSKERSFVIVTLPLFPDLSEALIIIFLKPPVPGLSSIAHAHALVPPCSVHDAFAFFKAWLGFNADKSAVTELRLKSSPDILTATTASEPTEEYVLIAMSFIKMPKVLGNAKGGVLSIVNVADASSETWLNLSVAFANTEFRPSSNMSELMDMLEL